MPKEFNRRSIRLKGYDYSKAGLYFVTICCQDRAHRFGKVLNGQMVLNAAGLMVDRWIKEIPNKFADIHIDEYVVMPNHMHIIIVNDGCGVRVDLCVDPNNDKKPLNNHPIEDEHIGSPLHRVVQWFKTMTTNYYIQGVKNFGWERFNKKIWHRNYYEHIIRDDKAYNNIAQYIKNNPLNWDKDKFYRQQTTEDKNDLD